MKNLKAKKSTLKILAATSVCLFSLLTVFSAAFAWFTMNNDLGGGGMDITIEQINGRLHKVYFHAFSGVSDDPNSQLEDDKIFSFSKTPFATYEYDWSQNKAIGSTSDASKWDLEKYDYLNHDHPVLVLFELNKDYQSFTAGDIYIQGSTTVDGYLGARITEEGENYGLPYYTLPLNVVNSENNPTAICMKKDTAENEDGETIVDGNGDPVIFDYFAFSSVAHFRSRTFVQSSNVQNDPNVYSNFAASSTTLDFATSSLTTGQPFADVNNSTEVYSFTQNPFLYQSAANETVGYIALIIEYSPDAIGYIYTTYLGNAVLESWDNVLRFVCDWSLEVY